MRFFVYFFERYLTFCKEGLSLTGGDVERCQSSVPESRWCVCVGFGCLLSSQSVHSSGACGQEEGRVHSEISLSWNTLHNTIFFVPKQSKTAEKFNYLV